MATIKAWHFMAADRRLGYGDGRLMRKGQTLRVAGKPVMCGHGLHGSRRIIAALGYAVGPIICRVEIGGDIVEYADKLVGNTRKTLWWIDGTMLLREFACRVAEDALRVAGVKDERCWNAINVARRRIKGEATDKELSAAMSAAESAARSAAESAAMSAAWGAARSAAESAALSAAWGAARSAQNRRLTAMVCAANRKNAVLGG